MTLSRKSDRRRRLLVDASTPLGDAPAATGTPRERANPKGSLVEARLYTIAAERRHQRKTTDLIPKRRMAYGITIIAFVMAIVTLNLLAIYSVGWQAVIGFDGVAALKMWGPGTICSWFATVCWIAAAAVCLQVFVLRRHRNDDYDGTYRVWGWLTVACVFASLVCNVNLPAIAASTASYFASISFTDPAWLPLAMMGVLASVFVVRVLFEVRYSYGTVAWVAFAWVVFGFATLVPLLSGEPQNAGGELLFGWLDSTLLVGNAMLIVAVSALMANLTYARYVFFRANGMIKPRMVDVAAVEAVSGDDAVVAPKENGKSKVKKRVATKTETVPKKTKSAKPKRKAAPKPAATRTATAKPAVASESKATIATPVAKPVVKATPAVQPTAQPVAAPPTGNLSASEKLRQMAAASRAKQAAAEAAPVAPQEASSGHEKTVKMSKAERRKLRKQQRQSKRAA